MLQEIDLRALSELQGSERAFVSFYAATPADINMLSQKKERLRHLLEEDPEELEHFERSMTMAEEAIRKEGLKAAGLCVFACYALDFLKVFHLSAEAPSLLRLDAAPFIRPLARLQDEFEDFLVVAADNKRTRIFHVAAEDVEMAKRVRGDVKNAVKKGGWSQQRYSRRRDQQLRHYALEVAEQLQSLVQENDISRIVLVGSQETLLEIEAALPKPLKKRVVGSKSIDLHEGQDHLIEEAYELFFEAEEGEEKALWKRIQAAYARGGLAALGASDVLAAIVNGRAESLLINTGAKLAGRHCRDCDNVMADSPDACPYCDSTELFSIDLVDRLCRQAELTSAEIEFADPPIEALKKVGQVGVLLRY